jgi:ribonuclease III
VNWQQWVRALFGRARRAVPREVWRRIGGLQKRIGYRFRDRRLLVDSLMHRSALALYGQDRQHSNERLEFLGDAVLDFIVAEHFYRLFPDMAEGELTKLRSVIASGSVLARAAEQLGLGAYVLLSANEERTGGRARSSILEDSFEALVGAIYLDGGHGAAADFVETYLLENWRQVVQQREFINYKSLLLEHVQSQQWSAPVYALREESGPDHLKHFVVEVLINGVVHGRGEGRSKKAAEQDAAYTTARQLGLLPHFASDALDAAPPGA